MTDRMTKIESAISVIDEDEDASAATNNGNKISSAKSFLEMGTKDKDEAIKDRIIKEGTDIVEAKVNGVEFRGCVQGGRS